MKNKDLTEQLRKHLPPIFAATELDQLTGKSILWATIQNRRSLDKKNGTNLVPDEIFTYSGCKKVLIIRDKFLDWWVSSLS